MISAGIGEAACPLDSVSGQTVVAEVRYGSHDATKKDTAGETRVAFCVTVAMASGKRIIEHVIVHLARGKIVRQVDVEAWD